jgi:uncharacterized protein YkwD
VHHLPAGPPLSARVAEALTRWAVLGRRVHLRRSGRLALGVMVSAVVTALVLAIPVVAGTGTGTGSPLTGSDGRPVPSAAFAGLTSAATLSSATEESSVVPSATGTSVEDVPTTSPSATGTSIEDVPTTSPSAIGRLPSAPAPTAPKPAVPGPGSASDSPAEPVTAAGAKVAAPEPSTSATPAAPVTTPAGPEAEVLALVNAERAAVGCEALAADVELAAVARAHSEDMRDRGFFDHVNLDGLDPFERAEAAGVTARAENIARGQQDATDVMAAWMDSSGHRANILDCGLTRLGISVASGGGGPWWTQLFA